MGLFSDISDAIFGTKSEANTTQQPTMTAEQQKLLKSLVDQFNAGGNPLEQTAATPYTGKLTAPTSGLQNLSLAALEQQAMNLTGPDSVMTAAGDAVKRGASGTAANIDKYFTESVQDPLLKAFEERVLPDVTRRFAGSAAFGSDRKTAERQTTEDLMKTLTASRSDIAFKADEAAKNRQLTAAGIAPSLAGAPTNILSSILAAGAIPQITEQADLTAQYQEFLRQQQGQKDRLNQMLAALGLKPFENITTVTPGSAGLLQGLSSGAGAFLAKAGMAAL